MPGARLSHLFLHVTDLVRARAFYVDTLGLALLVDDGGYVRVGGSDGFAMGMEAMPPEEVGAVGIEIVVRVDDVDASHSRMRRAGVVFDSEPTDMEWGARHAWLRDPDGYRLSIYTPLTEATGP